MRLPQVRVRDDSRWRGIAVLVPLVALLMSSAPKALRLSWQRLKEVWTLRGEKIEDARRRVYGEAYWDGIERLRAAIPKGGAYFLSKDGPGEGADYWIRFDLAPRRPIFVKKSASGVHERPQPAGEGPEFVVAARGENAPVLLDPGAFWDGAPVLREEVEDVGIPANIDVPAEGAFVRGPVIVSGWCQEPGGRPCADVRLYLDAELRSDGVERLARPDVEAAVAGIGDCGRAGYRSTLLAVEPGTHLLWVLFRTGDGRYRRFGPRAFTVSP